MIDFDRFLREHVEITNEGGGRGWDSGVRTFCCPFCGDEKNRGWMGIDKMGAGCFNIGCVAEPTLPGGAVEWARRVLNKISKGETYRYLVQKYGTDDIVVPTTKDLSIDDWCMLPESSRLFTPQGEVSVLEASFLIFIRSQWGLSPADAQRWSLRWCMSGPHAWRVIIPVIVGGQIVGFQARTTRKAEPKYVTSRHGKPDDRKAECGRPAARMLFNVDALRPGLPAVIVEGSGDVMGWAKDPRHAPAVGLLGVALTPQKAAMIASARPGHLTVALDDEPEAQARGRGHVAVLRSYGLTADLGQWVGGKDAGSGAGLEIMTQRSNSRGLATRTIARRGLPSK